MPAMNPQHLEECARVCRECQEACLQTIVYCLGIGGEHASRELQTTLTDCAGICGLSHNLLHRQSHHHQHTCRACAAICHACAQLCAGIGHDDPAMRRCEDACRKCAQSCEHMSAANAG